MPSDQRRRLFCRLHKEEHCRFYRYNGPRGELILATRECPSRCRVEGLRWTSSN